jgi:ATP-dependent helicase/nuclease subunit A
MERDGRGWLMNLDGLTWEQPPDLALRATEKSYLVWERRRIIYVALTRARDLLVLPRGGETASDPKRISAGLLNGKALEQVRELPLWQTEVAPPDWAQPIGRVEVTKSDVTELEQNVAAQWATRTIESSKGAFKPISVSESVVGTLYMDIEEPGIYVETEPNSSVSPIPLPGASARKGRFGPIFGTTVHRAIGIALRNPALSPVEAVEQSARFTGLTEHLDTVVEDVSRTISALKSEGLFRIPGDDLQIEYPLAGVLPNGDLVSGYADLVALSEQGLIIIDFKTDTGPGVPVEEAYPAYVAQVRGYRQLLRESAVPGSEQMRCGLLFTQQGSTHWI